MLEEEAKLKYCPLKSPNTQTKCKTTSCMWWIDYGLTYVENDKKPDGTCAIAEIAMGIDG